MRYMIVQASGGVIGDTFSCDKLELAIAKGKALWKEATGVAGLHQGVESMHEDRKITPWDMRAEEEGYDVGIGAVRRGYEAHWFNDDEDVWVIQPEVIM